ncbi:replication factor RFC1 C terminal domain-containing protein [Coniochaeta sp. 2T2.1]|nr:replication factor RFC1 C terminal domain-containing protein [Coniochaeta sp. 2T2.1]
MPDIRSFFAPKNGSAPPKPTPKKEEEPAKKKPAARSRKILDDSDDDVVDRVKKPAAKAAPKKKAAEPKPVKEIDPDEYFASSSKAKPSKTKSTPKKSTYVKPKVEIEPRASPRNKQPASKPTPVASPAKPAAPNGTKRGGTTAYKDYKEDDDGDAFMDDEDDADDIFAADIKARSKLKKDEYVEEEDSDDDVMVKPKKAPARGKRAATEESDEDSKPTPKKARTSTAKKPAAAASKKRKSKATKPRAPRAKKEPEKESSEIQSILDNVPTIDAPDAPPKVEGAKFDWRNAGGGGNAGPPPMAGAVEIPEGEDNCLLGKSFVFTGLLKTIGRDEATALVKRYGGKVTGAPSSKTDFVVLGDDAGPSKLRKIKEHGIKTIDEQGLFYLIKSLPGEGGSGKAAEKAKQKQEEAEKKMREQAAEMERQERQRKAEAAKAQAAVVARGAVASAPPAPLSQLWTTKYAPTAMNQICGNKANVERIQSWLHNWHTEKRYDFQRRGKDGMGTFRAIIISGPPGIGKTTAAHLAAKLEGFDVLEQNASDSRSKKLVDSGLTDAVDNTSLLGYFAGDGKKVDLAKKKMVLIMDEVDGMSAGDRGGVGALAKFCKKTQVPLILICNDRKLPKMKPFDFVTFDIKFQRPTVDQIRSRIMSICYREQLKLPPQAVDALIEGSNRDIRQIINMISTAKLDQDAMTYDKGKEMSKAWEKHIVLKPWDICQQMLAGGLFAPSSKSTLNDKIELYFNDHEFSFLMIQENYLRTKPMLLSGKGYNARENNLKHLELVDQAAESISDGDLVDRMIHGPQQQWSLMPTHAVFSTVRPSSFVAGQLMGSNFTSWLGNFSKTGKLGRYVREIHSHMRLRSSGDHNEIRQQYLPVLWHQIVKRLEVEGRDSVEDVINLMDSYFLTRDDFDYIKELGVGPQSEDRVNIETQTKAAFTRTYNAMSHPVPFMKASNVSAAGGKAKAAPKEMPDLEEAIEEDDDAAAAIDDAADNAADDDDDGDITKDKYIKQPKKKAAPKKAAAAGGKKAAAPKKAKGKGK